MIKCDCFDPERHGHLDDCPLAEVESLRARLADIESQNRVMWDVANDREARLAEAEGAIESAGRCLALSNDGPREALLILSAYKNCQRDALSKDAERYRWLRANNSSDGKFCISIEDDDDPSVVYSGHSSIELDSIIDAAMEWR